MAIKVISLFCKQAVDLFTMFSLAIVNDNNIFVTKSQYVQFQRYVFTKV